MLCVCACVHVCTRGHANVAKGVAQEGQTCLGAGEPAVKNSYNQRFSMIRNVHATAKNVLCPFWGGGSASLQPEWGGGIKRQREVREPP